MHDNGGPLPIRQLGDRAPDLLELHVANEDRKSTRLNSSHRCISYAVFCLTKKSLNTFLRLLLRRSPTSTLFPYTTLFRSRPGTIATSPSVASNSAPRRFAYIPAPRIYA